MIIRNAKITNTLITNDAHGSLSIFIFLDFGDFQQGFGGWSLYSPNLEDETKEPVNNENYTGHVIWRILKIADCRSWEKLIGKNVRAMIEGSYITKIGHILQDEWFDPGEWLSWKNTGK